jgi:hypothetical protein
MPLGIRRFSIGETGNETIDIVRDIVIGFGCCRM